MDAKNVASAVALVSAKYRAGQEDEAIARLTLRSVEPLTLVFPSGETYEVRVLDQEGESVSQWSIHRLFLQVGARGFDWRRGTYLDGQLSRRADTRSKSG